MRILVIEDEQLLRGQLTDHLKVTAPSSTSGRTILTVTPRRLTLTELSCAAAGLSSSCAAAELAILKVYRTAAGALIASLLTQCGG